MNVYSQFISEDEPVLVPQKVSTPPRSLLKKSLLKKSLHKKSVMTDKKKQDAQDESPVVDTKTENPKAEEKEDFQAKKPLPLTEIADDNLQDDIFDDEVVFPSGKCKKSYNLFGHVHRKVP